MNRIAVERYRRLNRSARKGQILFVGSSLMEHFPINEILMSRGIDLCIYNRGISGYTIPELLESMNEQIFDLEPSVIFINIGTNDISIPEMTPERFTSDYRMVLDQIKDRLPKTKVFMMAFYPVNPVVAEEVKPWPEAPEAARLRIERIPWANSIMEGLANEYNFEFIDVGRGLSDDAGIALRDLSMDGIHFWPDAYEIIFDNMKEYLF